MLAFIWVALRFIHFTTLMLVFGCALYGAWLAPVSVRRLMMRRFFCVCNGMPQRGALSARR
ncbi:Copper resistance protein D [Citrobacter freundii]|uniref:Copper resistance protein D n=1 Tax=Citrobacter freundii TaxID=546 RepID=A0A7G2ITF2_CITFR|nr:Copper resistance protein D [Citrobacter freundii]